jgi:hypothetical protein
MMNMEDAINASDRGKRPKILKSSKSAAIDMSNLLLNETVLFFTVIIHFWLVVEIKEA